MHNFRLFIRLETTYIDQSHIRILLYLYHRRLHTSVIKMSSANITFKAVFFFCNIICWDNKTKNSAYLSGTGWRSNSGNRSCH